MLDLLKQIAKGLFYQTKSRSYSQLGEDLVLMNHLEWLGKSLDSDGFYIDIGAFHPIDGSNTYALYRLRSRGVVVDIGTSKKTLFKIFRPQDHFINAAIVPDVCDKKELTFRLSGYGKKTDCIIEGIGKGGDNSLVRVSTLKISELLSDHLQEQRCASWSVLSLDIEGHDQEVIMSIDFEVYQFNIVLFESFSGNDMKKFHDHLKSDCHKHMESFGYALQSVCGPTFIYVRLNSVCGLE